MNPHFFTAPFSFAFIWFRVQGSGFRVQGGVRCTCQQKLDTKLKKLGIKIEYLYKIQ